MNCGDPDSFLVVSGPQAMPHSSVPSVAHVVPCDHVASTMCSMRELQRLFLFC